MSSKSWLLSFGCCSGINSFLRCSVCMCICSKGSSSCGFFNRFQKRQFVINLAAFMPVLEYMQCVRGSWVIVLYVSYMILISCLETTACLPDICLVACIASDIV
jgi:hypothetical protein